VKSVVEGRVRELDPIVLEESFSIGREALLNALAHSSGSHVEVEILYETRQFRLRIRDDGRGIHPEIRAKRGRSDHWGMRGMRERARGLVLAFLSLAWCSQALALDPRLDVSQYVHTSWRIREGFARGAIRAIAQTPDGYLWLGTDFGLLRFDGVRNVPWPSATDPDLSPAPIMSLLAERDGTLWIGTATGLLSWKDGRLTPYTELAGHYIFSLLQDREGAVWVAGVSVPTGKLCAVRPGNVECHGEDGRLGRGVFDLYEDSRGSLWAGVNAGVWRWKPGPPRFFALPAKSTVVGLGEDDNGVLLVGGQGGIQRFVDGKTEAYWLRGRARELSAGRILRDRSGARWIAAYERGIAHLHEGRTDVFTRAEGLSSDGVSDFFEDREGNLWVATSGGLDRFRDPAVTTLSPDQGMPGHAATSVLAARDGSVWLATPDGLMRWANGRMTTPRTGGAKPDGRLDGLNPLSLFQDSRGRIWVSTLREVGYVENERFTPVRALPGGVVRSFAEDPAGTLWIAYQDSGLLGLSRDNAVQLIPWARLGHEDFASALIADPVGGLWIGFFRGGMAYVRDGQVRASYEASAGLGVGYVASLRFDPEGALWAATAGGLSRLKDGRIATLGTRSGLPCNEVHWAMEDDARTLWLYSACGLVQIARPELDAWTAAVDKDRPGANEEAKPTIHPTLFDVSDGVPIHPGPGGVHPLVAKSSDGKLWFVPGDGVSVLDPRHLPFNALPPAVLVEQVIADHKPYDPASGAKTRLRLPPQLRDLEIEYTATSLVTPEKVLFRYKLEGRDRDWVDAGARRRAFYNDLPPRNYRFRVIACNNSGVWNEAGAVLDFSVAPAYYQTAWFRLTSAALIVASAMAAYRLRLRQATSA
jgi:ligand-binding sensor domain-containing protein